MTFTPGGRFRGGRVRRRAPRIGMGGRFLVAPAAVAEDKASSIFTLAFWRGAGERAGKTFVQTFVPAFLLALGATSTGTLDAWTAPWLTALQSAGGLGLGAVVLSLATSLLSADFVAGTVPVKPDAHTLPVDPPR